MLCFVSFHKVSLVNLQFSSYANFSKYQRVIIPINPQIPIFTGGIDSGKIKSVMSDIPAQKIEFDSIISSGAKKEVVDNVLIITPETNDPILIFAKPIHCPLASDIGIAIEMNRYDVGWVQIFWDEAKNFTESKSIKRFYPFPEIKAQFAFPASSQDNYIKIHLVQQKKHAQIKQITAYCLP